MYYELYIDVLFLVNFMMDYLLLLTAGKMLTCTATHVSIFAGAFLGAIAACAVICIPGHYVLLKFILFHIVINTIMIRTGLKIKERKKFLQAYLLLYICAFFLGGVMQFLGRHVKTAGLFVLLAAISYEVMQGAFWMLAQLRHIQNCRCRVTLYINEIPCTVEALIDTGNQLCDPVTGVPVHVIGSQALPKEWKQQSVQEIRMIPFRSVGQSGGMIPAIPADKMIVEPGKGKTSICIQKPLIGICREKEVFQGSYQMILNPDIF